MSSAAEPTRGRKRRRIRREDIVTEATRLFAERGYEGTSMGDLAERVGLRKASLFHHFPSKDALYAAVLEGLVTQVRTALASAMSKEGTFEERLDALSDALTATLGSQPHAARLLVREALDEGPVMRDLLARPIDEVLAASLEFANAGKRAGTFANEVDPTHAILSLIGVHFMPFALGTIVERFTGKSVFQGPFVDERKTAVRQQARRLVLQDKGP